MLKTLVVIVVAFSVGFFANEYLRQQENPVTLHSDAYLSPGVSPSGIAIAENEQVSVAADRSPGGIQRANDLSPEALSWVKVEQLIANHQFADAITLLRAALDKTPASSKTWLWLAKVYQAAGNHRDAVMNWLEYLHHEPDAQQRDNGRIELKNYLSKLAANMPAEFDASWLAQQLDTFIQLTTDDPELHLMTAGLYITANDSYQAQYHALMAANSPQTQERAEAILAQLHGNNDHVNDDMVLPLTRYGNQFLVNVNIEGNPARLLLDTGASLSGVSTHYLTKYPNIVKTTKPIRLNTANGVVDSYLFTVNRLDIGNAVFNQHILARLPLDSAAEFDGLLGVDILGRFNFVIDQNEAVLRLGKRR